MKSTNQLIKLADIRDVDSKFELAYRLAFNKKAFKNPPWKKIFKYWKFAAESGHLRAMFYTGVCYDNGNGVKKNLVVAFDWYLKATNLRQRDAQFNSGYFYDTGEIVKKKFKKKIILVFLGSRSWFD